MGKISNDSELSSLEWHYIEEHSAAVAFGLDEDSGPGARLFFKGQQVGFHGGILELPCRVYVDVFGDAEELLAVNRRSFRNFDVLDRVRSAVATAAAQALEKVIRNDHRALLSALLLALEKPITDEYLQLRWLESSDERTYARRYRYVQNAEGATFPTMGELIKSDARLYQAFGDYSPRYLRVEGRLVSSTDDSLSLFFKAIIQQGYKGYIDSVSHKGVVIGWAKDREAWDMATLRKLFLANLIPGLRLALPVTKAFAPLASFKWTSRVGELSRSPFCPNHDYMYSPFILENGKMTISNLDDLVAWTFLHRRNKTVSIEEIHHCYKNFIVLIDQAMRADSNWANVVGYTV